MQVLRDGAKVLTTLCQWHSLCVHIIIATHVHGHMHACACVELGNSII